MAFQMPPLNLSLPSNATSNAANAFAGAQQSFGSGAWNVNLGGSGAANFSANAAAASASPSLLGGGLGGSVGGIPTWALLALAVGALWALK